MIKNVEKCVKCSVGTKETRLTMLVTLCYGRHRNHGLKQEADCCKIAAQLTNDDKYKGQNRHTLPFQTATGDEIWVCGYDPSAIHIA